MFRDWIPKRKATVDALQVFADKLMSHHNKICIAQVTGSSASVVGFVIVTVGFGLAFVTLGTSLILSAVGGGISAAGGLTNAGSSIAEVCIQRILSKLLRKSSTKAEKPLKPFKSFRKN